MTSIDPAIRAMRALAWLLHPMTPATFMDRYYEKQPLLIKRGNALHYDSRKFLPGSFQLADVMRIVGTDGVVYEHDVDVTLYSAAQDSRDTLNKEGPVDVQRVNDLIKSKLCSVRLRCPQSRDLRVFRLLESLEPAFGSYVGCNVYCTPANSQGFAPHYDDIEAFILQTMGCKRWRVYPPRGTGGQSGILPRHSSRDYKQHEAGEPVLECLLEPGDLLYIPRGWVHQAVAVPPGSSLDDSRPLKGPRASDRGEGEGNGDRDQPKQKSFLPQPPSVHLTVSSGLHMTWHDFLEEAVRGTLATMVGDTGMTGDAVDGAAGQGGSRRREAGALDLGLGDEDEDEGEGEGELDEHLAVALRKSVPADFVRCTGVVWQEDDDDDDDEDEDEDEDEEYEEQDGDEDEDEGRGNRSERTDKNTPAPLEGGGDWFGSSGAPAQSQESESKTGFGEESGAEAPVDWFGAPQQAEASASESNEQSGTPTWLQNWTADATATDTGDAPGVGGSKAASGAKRRHEELGSDLGAKEFLESLVLWASDLSELRAAGTDKTRSEQPQQYRGSSAGAIGCSIDGIGKAPSGSGRLVTLPASEVGLARAHRAVSLVQQAVQSYCPPVSVATYEEQAESPSPDARTAGASAGGSRAGEGDAPYMPQDSESVHHDRLRRQRRALLLRHGAGFLQEFARRLASLDTADYAFDRLAGKHMLERLPPPDAAPANEGEGEGEKLKGVTRSSGSCPITGRSLLRLRFPGHTHMAVEGGVCVVRHAVGNTRRFREAGPEAGVIELSIEAAPAVEALVRTWPAWLRPMDLPLLNGDDGSSGGVEEHSPILEALGVLQAAKLIEVDLELKQATRPTPR